MLVGNPVTLKPNYRAYAIFKIPSLEVIDYVRVKLKERREAVRLFQSAAGKKVDEAIRTAAEQQPSKEQGKSEVNPLPADAVERRLAIQKAISEAKSKEEIERLENMLAAGFVPNSENTKTSSGHSDVTDKSTEVNNKTTNEEEPTNVEKVATNRKRSASNKEESAKNAKTPGVEASQDTPTTRERKASTAKETDKESLPGANRKQRISPSEADDSSGKNEDEEEEGGSSTRSTRKRNVPARGASSKRTKQSS